MHRNLHSPTKLTEFARDFDSEEPDSFFGKIVSRLTSAYNTSYNTVNVAPATSTLQLAAAVRKPVAMRPPEQPKNNVNTGGVSPAEATSSSSGSSTSLPLRTPPAVATATADRPNSFASNNQRSSTPSSSCGRNISIDDMSAAERVTQLNPIYFKITLKHFSSLPSRRHRRLQSGPSVSPPSDWPPSLLAASGA